MLKPTKNLVSWISKLEPNVTLVAKHNGLVSKTNDSIGINVYP